MLHRASLALAPIKRCLSTSVKDARTQALLDRVIRVDHAGEFGADRIYAGQLAVLGKTSVGPLIKILLCWSIWSMMVPTFYESENNLSPCALEPLVSIMKIILVPTFFFSNFVFVWAGTALLGKEAAMACTVAVEDVIGDHYNNQIRELVEDDPEKHKELLEIVKKFRDDELHHHDTGLKYDAEKAPFYGALTQVIKIGCKGAIWISERI
ncbi:unnamed protein product [Candidula unifasciata]|uniref:Ubiquinone biosynthesis monooxygenase COQ7 n=1 Tax=Candidula unifasciata TaxID=100452 RepID=A0A8S3ZIL6_9EUPU|nr:unnamed protein product [Candidula unifasciata]